MIRKATIDDAARIAEINVYGWRNTYRGIISDEELFINRRVDKSIIGFSKAITENIDSIHVYEDDVNKIIKGIIGFSNSKDSDKLNAFELCFIYVETVFSREGIGTKLIKYFEEEAISIDKKEMIVWVLEKNTIGRNLYTKNGYAHDGATKKLDRLGAIEYRYSKVV